MSDGKRNLCGSKSSCTEIEFPGVLLCGCLCKCGKKTEIAEKFSDGKMELEKAKELNYKEILQNEEVKAYLEKGNENLGILGYTDHSEKHCAIVAKRAGMILSKFGYTEHEIELAEIAGAMHDIGNVINLGKVENAAERQNPCYVSDWKS